MDTECRHSTKLTGLCVKCGEYPYDNVTSVQTTKQTETVSGNAPKIDGITKEQAIKQQTGKPTNRQSATLERGKEYVEKDCIFEHEGRKFESGGAVVTPETIVAYPKENGILGDWHGNEIGTWCTVSTWKTPRSFMSSTMSQIEAKVNGQTYTGRGAGVGMIYKGKLKKA